MWGETFLLFDDARPGGKGARLYRDPVGTIDCDSLDGVVPALMMLRTALLTGRHVAGFMTYEAGLALDPALAVAYPLPSPLLWFAMFDHVEMIAPGALDGALPDLSAASIGPPRPRIGRSDYLASAEAIKERLFAGDLYQANLTFGCDVTVLGDPIAAYAALRRQAKAGWGGIVRHPGGTLLSLSPEQFFTIQDGVIEARPMKGTAPRGKDPVSDAANRTALAADPKQRAENLMIVDLLRNDLARIAEPGSVEVPRLFEVESFPTLHQMVSHVTARLRGDCDVIDVLRTIFPCGSITGAPKIAAITRLAALEQEARGAYTGSMGWIEPGGNCAFNVLIRTLDLPDGSPVARLGLGSGLVVDSIAADEWRECLLKGDFVTRSADLPDLIETMRFEPQDGLVALDRHFDRIRASADILGFRFDHHAARNELQAATFGRKGPAIARLLLSPSGNMAVEVRAMPEPVSEPVSIRIRPLPVSSGDTRLHHKTTNRAFYDEARKASDAFEIVFCDADGFLTEGSFTTVFVKRDGMLVTPPLSRGILPGVLRAILLESGEAEEGDLVEADLADGFFIGNVARGLIAARLA